MVYLYGEEHYSKEIFIPKSNFIIESGFNAYILYSMLSDNVMIVEAMEEFKSNDEG